MKTYFYIILYYIYFQIVKGSDTFIQSFWVYKEPNALFKILKLNLKFETSITVSCRGVIQFGGLVFAGFCM